jgi:hypothetical protein
MRKSDLTVDQVLNRDKFIKILTDKGWTIDESWLNACEPENRFPVNIIASYKNDNLHLQLYYISQINCIIQDCFCKKDGSLLNAIRLYPIQLEHLLHRFVAWQDKLSGELETQSEFLEEIVPLCERVLCDSQDGLAWMQLEDED